MFELHWSQKEECKKQMPMSNTPHPCFAMSAVPFTLKSIPPLLPSIDPTQKHKNTNPLLHSDVLHRRRKIPALNRLCKRV